MVIQVKYWVNPAKDNGNMRTEIKILEKSKGVQSVIGIKFCENGTT